MQRYKTSFDFFELSAIAILNIVFFGGITTNVVNWFFKEKITSSDNIFRSSLVREQKQLFFFN